VQNAALRWSSRPGQAGPSATRGPPRQIAFNCRGAQPHVAEDGGTSGASTAPTAGSCVWVGGSGGGPASPGPQPPRRAGSTGAWFPYAILARRAGVTVGHLAAVAVLPGDIEVQPRRGVAAHAEVHPPVGRDDVAALGQVMKEVREGPSGGWPVGGGWRTARPRSRGPRAFGHTSDGASSPPAGSVV